MSLNWQKLFSTNYGTFQIDPKLAETAPLFCRVTDVPFLPKWCDALRRVIKEGYQHAGMDVDSANFRRGRTGGERRGRRPRSRRTWPECHAFHLAQSTGDMMMSTLWQHIREDVHHLTTPHFLLTLLPNLTSLHFSLATHLPQGDLAHLRRHIDDNQKSTPVIVLRN